MFKDKGNIVGVSFLIITLLSVGIVFIAGCSSNTVESGDASEQGSLSMPTVETITDGVDGNKLFTSITGNYKTVQEILLNASSKKEAAISSALSDNNAVAGHAWLEDQGYSFVDTNSLVVIEREFKLVAKDPAVVGNTDTRSANKRFPDADFESVLIRADTLVWQAFENPTHDSANHTALVTYWRGTNEMNTIMFELDVSTETPTVIREGSIVGEEFVIGDNETTSFLGCLLSGAGAANIGCIWSNCGYGHCVAAAYTVALVGCGLSWAFSL